MKCFCWSSMFLALAVGCGQNNSSPVTSNPAPSEPAVAAVTTEPLPEGVVLVTLKLPEMT